jgi:acyl-CoA thioesterase YciA
MHTQESGVHPVGNLILQVIPMPGDTNPSGDIFAGWLVKQMDLAASTTAGSISGGRTATVAIERMEFLAPIRVGSKVGIYTKLKDIGHSSMKINVEVWCQYINDNTARKVTSAEFVFVAIDAKGNIRKVPHGE